MRSVLPVMRLMPSWTVLLPWMEASLVAKVAAVPAVMMEKMEDEVLRVQLSEIWLSELLPKCCAAPQA